MSQPDNFKIEPGGESAHSAAAPILQPLSASGQTVYTELSDIYIECHRPNWDGEGAEPLHPDAVGYAAQFLQALPAGYPMPSVGAEPDGHLSLEWYRATNWLLSVSVSSEGMLYYAALLGDQDPRGHCQFDRKVPPTILDLIRRVCAP